MKKSTQSIIIILLAQILANTSVHYLKTMWSLVVVVYIINFIIQFYKEEKKNNRLINQTDK
jgi:hypothetical protein